MVKKWVALLLSTMFVLSACNSPVYNQTEGNVADIKIKAAKAVQRQDVVTKSQPSLLVKKGLYVDATPISIEKQPVWLKNHIVVRGDQLPFSYYSRVIASGANNKVLTTYQTGLNQTLNITVNYTGTVQGALDLLAAKTGYVYTISKSGIYWQAFVTKTYDIAFMPGGTDYMMGQTSGATGATSASGGGGTSGTVSDYVSSDSSAAQYSNLKGTLSVWKDLETTIKQLMSPEGKVVVSESTTSVTVRDRPTNVELVGQYIKNLNHNLSKQVLVKIQVLEVTLENDYNMGLDWSLIAKGFNQSNFIVKGNYGTPVAITSLTTQVTGQSTPQMGTTFPDGKIPGVSILLNALSQQGKTSVVSEPRVVCLNNQVSVARIVTSKGYMASIQNTSLAAGTSGTTATTTSQITPGTIVTGLTLYILPKILRNSIYLQVNADLSTLNSLDKIGPQNADGSTTTQIQVPTVSQKSFNQRSVIRTGDTLILSGFRQVTNQTGANQFLQSQALGGKASIQKNVETIILITPIILHGSA